MPKVAKLYLILFLCWGVFPRAARSEETLTWADCVREAAKNNPDLIAAQEEVKQSEAAKRITASTLFPQVDSNLNASTAKTSTSTRSTTADNYSYGVTGSQLIFDGMKTINDVRSASENIKASQEGFRFTSATVRFRLRSAFINLLRAQEMLRITKEIYDIRRGNYELILLRYESGLEHKGALLTAEADLADARYRIIQAERDVEVSQRELTKEMGREHLVGMKVAGDFNVRDQAREKPDFEVLAKDNPSLQQAFFEKKAAEYGLKSAYANFFPTLTGEAGANKTSPRWPAKNDQWNLGLTVSLPIFEGGLRLAQVNQAQALLNQLKENERSTRDAIMLNLEGSWAALQDAVDNAEVQRKLLIADEERSKIAQAQYSTGFTTFDNWIIIEDNLVSQKRTYLDAQAAALTAEAEWIQAKGEVLENAP